MEQGSAQEYLTGNESIAFPFKEDAEGLTQKDGTPIHGVAAILPRDFLLDLVMTAPAQYQCQVHFKSISRTGSVYTFIFTGIVCGDLFTGTVSSIPAVRSIVAMQSVASRITIRMVTGPSFSTYLAGIVDGTTDSFQERLPLETAAVEFVPLKLMDLILDAQDMPGDIVLYEGYNIQLDSTPSDPITGTPAKLTITAGSGLGAGKYDPCNSDPCDPNTDPVGYIGRINGQTADKNGNLQLDGDACYRILPDETASRLQLANDCLPCCTCDDYANQVAALKLLYADLVRARDYIDDTVTKVNADITEWNNVIVPELFKVTADIYVTRGNQTGVFLDSDRKIASGRSLNYASVIVVVRNPRNVPLTNLSVAIGGIGSPLQVSQSVYFDGTGQHLSGTSTSWSGISLDPGKYFKPIVLIKNIYPAVVSGTFTVTISATGIDPVTKSVTV